LHPAFLLLWAFLAACSSAPQTTMLWEELPSYARASDIKARLRIVANRDGWTEKRGRSDAADTRPQYDFLTLVGPRESYGVPGEVTFTFYNDRLMSTSFKGSCEQYIEALRSHGMTMPDKPSAEITIDRRTVFRYDRQQTNCRFLWVDPKLEREWMDWIREHA
jgi:hypothetical protein